MPRVISAFTQFLDDNGDPLISGTLTFYEPGTTTDKDTYSDLSESIANANPLPLSATGRCPDVFGSGSYKVVSKDSDGVQIQSFDPVGGIFGLSPFESWNSLTTYSIGSIVIGSDDNYYRSLTADNQANDPTSDAVNWEQFEFVFYYNANRTYVESDRVRDATGYMYTSLQAANLANTPATSTDYWIRDDVSQWTVKTANYPAAANDMIDADTDTVGAFTITLPVDPTQDDIIGVHDYKGTWNTNNLTITSAADDIGNNTGDLICNIKNRTHFFKFDSTVGWKVL